MATIYLGVAEREEETSANFRIAGGFTEFAWNATEATQVAKRSSFFLTDLSVLRRAA